MIDGDLTVTGLKGAIVPHVDGTHRLLCAIESPQSWFEDFGKGTLKNGKANITLDSDFATLVSLKKGTYHVFVTPYAETKGLYVTRRTATGFQVREQQGGTSNAAFSYRIVAKRKGVASERLATVVLPTPLSIKKRPAKYRGTDPFPQPHCPQPK
ncbi:MAG: hypothetical protein DME97_06780 [Verrucomicrobia bacterium]|nr:MAG: hypothetical protein DME97_06780 [Verrucomicrobiota bacterium]